MPLNIRIQWNAGTDCVSESVLKTLACRGLRVGPFKIILALRVGTIVRLWLILGYFLAIFFLLGPNFWPVQCGATCNENDQKTARIRRSSGKWICSVAAFGPSSAEDANHASFPCLVSQEFPQTNLYEIRC